MVSIVVNAVNRSSIRAERSSQRNNPAASMHGPMDIFNRNIIKMSASANANNTNMFNAIASFDDCIVTVGEIQSEKI